MRALEAKGMQKLSTLSQSDQHAWVGSKVSAFHPDYTDAYAAKIDSIKGSKIVVDWLDGSGTWSALSAEMIFVKPGTQYPT